MTNLTEKFEQQAEVIRGTRPDDLATVLIEGLPGPIGEEVAASALAANTANEIAASALAANTANEIAASALAANVGAQVATTLDPRLAEIINLQQFWGQEITSNFGPLTGQIYDLQLAMQTGFTTVGNAIASLAECCAALGLAINGLRDDVQAGNASTAAGLGKIGSNQESPPPAPPAPPPAPGGTGTYWVCGRFSPAWVYVGDNPTSGQAVWRAYSTAPAGISVGIVGADGWGPAETDGAGLYFEPGTYRFEQVGGAGGTIKTGGSTPIGNPLPQTATYVTTATQIDFFWEGSGSPSQASIAICRKRVLA